MHIRTFEASTLQEALVEIRRQMGPEATILHTRNVRRGIGGLLRKVEVTAGLKNEQPETQVVGSTDGSNELTQQQWKTRYQALQLQIETLSKRIESLHQQPSDQKTDRMVGLPSDSRSKIDQLIFSIMEERPADSQTADDHWLKQKLCSRVRTTGPIKVASDRQSIVAIVGPTGVGKTTTIAKLAAGFRLEKRKNVGLITIDTFRTAAIDQLRRYAEVMRLPLEVVSNEQEMDRALRALNDQDLVLIDTIGRSPCDQQQVRVVQQLLKRAVPRQTLLVLSATTSYQVNQMTCDYYRGLNPDAVIVSKVDEVESQPDLLLFAEQDALPVSYVTTGQQVPQDIETATAGQLVSLAMGTARYRGRSETRRNLLATLN